MVYAVIEILLKAYSVVQGRMTERKNKRSLDVRVCSEIVPVNEAQRIVLIEISNRSTEQVNVTALKRTIGQGFFRRRHQVKASVTEFCRVMAEAQFPKCMHGLLIAAARQARGDALPTMPMRWNHRR